MEAPLAGGITEVAGVENDLHTVELARFALDEHNKKAVSFFPLLLLFCDPVLIHGALFVENVLHTSF